MWVPSIQNKRENDIFNKGGYGIKTALTTNAMQISARVG